MFAWSPLPSQITVHVAKRRATQTFMCESLMKVKTPSVYLPSLAKIQELKIQMELKIKTQFSIDFSHMLVLAVP